MRQKRSHVDSSCIVAWYHICQHICHKNALVFYQSITTDVQLSSVASSVYTGKKPKPLWRLENSFCGCSNLLLRYWLINHDYIALFFLVKFILPCQLYCLWDTRFLGVQLFIRITAFCTINIQCWFLTLLASQSFPFQTNSVLFVIQQLKWLLDFPFKTLACFSHFLFSRGWFCHIVNPFFFFPLFFLRMDVVSELCWNPLWYRLYFPLLS